MAKMNLTELVVASKIASKRGSSGFGTRYDVTVAKENTVNNSEHWSIISNIRKVIGNVFEIRIADNSDSVLVVRRLLKVDNSKVEQLKQANYVITVSASNNYYANMVLVLNKQECINGNIADVYVADGCENMQQARAKALEYIASQSNKVVEQVTKVPKAKSKAK